MAGETARFYCSGENPYWTIMVDGVEYQQLHRRAVQQGIRRHHVENSGTLVVSNVNMKDNGNTYRCTYPEVGSQYCTSLATLYVTGGRK